MSKIPKNSLTSFMYGPLSSLQLGNTSARNETKGDTADSIPFHSSLLVGAKSAPPHREESDSGGLNRGEDNQESESSDIVTFGKLSRHTTI